VQEQTGHLQRLIEDLLEFSRLESGQIRLHATQLALDDLVINVVEKLAPLADNQAIRLDIESLSPLPDVEADPTRVEQVVTNLVENAIKFTPRGGQVALAGETGKDQVQLTIRDTGIGIPAEEMPRIFEKFYQVDPTQAGQVRGFGLGLFYARQFIQDHHGTMTIESLPGAGTTVAITLPRKSGRS